MNRRRSALEWLRTRLSARDEPPDVEPLLAILEEAEHCPRPSEVEVTVERWGIKRRYELCEGHARAAANAHGQGAEFERWLEDARRRYRGETA